MYTIDNLEYWSVGVMGFESRSQARSRCMKPNTPSFHYSFTPFPSRSPAALVELCVGFEREKIQIPERLDESERGSWRRAKRSDPRTRTRMDREDDRNPFRNVDHRRE